MTTWTSINAKGRSACVRLLIQEPVRARVLAPVRALLGAVLACSYDLYSYGLYSYGLWPI